MGCHPSKVSARIAPRSTSGVFGLPYLSGRCHWPAGCVWSDLQLCSRSLVLATTTFASPLRLQRFGGAWLANFPCLGLAGIFGAVAFSGDCTSCRSIGLLRHFGFWVLRGIVLWSAALSLGFYIWACATG